MKRTLIALWMLAFGLFSASIADAEVLAYPSTEHTSFNIDYPADWEMTPGETVGDYTTVMSPGGTLLMFRTVPNDRTAVADAIKDLTAYSQENYTGVQMGEVKEMAQHGLTGAFMAGAGRDAEIGEVVLGMFWFVLADDGTVAEVWFVSPVDDEEGRGQAKGIVKSLRGG